MSILLLHCNFFSCMIASCIDCSVKHAWELGRSKTECSKYAYFHVIKILHFLAVLHFASDSQIPMLSGWAKVFSASTKRNLNKILIRSKVMLIFVQAENQQAMTSLKILSTQSSNKFLIIGQF